MPKEIKMRLDFTSNIVEVAKKAETVIAALAAKKEKTVMEKAAWRQQVGGMDAWMKQYGAGGKSQYSGYKPKGFFGDNPSSMIDWIGGKQSMYEIDQMMPKKKSGGKGGIMEALGLGALAGGAAGGVMLLVGALKDMAGESQILSKFFGTVGKLLGTLIDLVLLPFLPILVWAMMWLATNVMKFGNFWSEFITTLKEKGILGLLKLSLTTDDTGIIGWTKALLLYLFGTEEEKKKALALLFKWNLEITDWATKWGEVILGFFFGTEADKKKSLIATLGLEKGVLNGIGEILFGPILDFFFGSEDKAVIKKTIGAWLDIHLHDVTNVLLGIISPFLQFFFGGDKTVEKKLVLSVDFLVGAGQWLVDLMLNLASLGMIKGWDWGKTPMGVSGGGGSSYTPKELPASINSQSRGGNTFIFQGYQDDKFIAKVKDVLRSEGTRYTQ